MIFSAFYIIKIQDELQLKTIEMYNYKQFATILILWDNNFTLKTIKGSSL